jgi:hypothetical protein
MRRSQACFSRGSTWKGRIPICQVSMFTVDSMLLEGVWPVGEGNYGCIVHHIKLPGPTTA